MKTRALVLFGFAFILTVAHGQSDNAVHVKAFPGQSVGEKVAAAQLTCNSNPVIPCLLVVDPSLAGYAAGTMPTLCSHCYLIDWRNGPTGAAGVNNQPIHPSRVTSQMVNNTYHSSAFPSSCTIGGVAYTTSGDCAVATLKNLAATTGVNPTLIVDPGETDTCSGWDFPVNANDATVSLVGASGYPGSYDENLLQNNFLVLLKQICNIGAKAVITYESSAGLAGGEGPVATISGLYIDANNNASACGDFGKLSRSSIHDLLCAGVTGTHAHGFRFGNSSAPNNQGWEFQMNVQNLEVDTQAQIPFTFGSGQVTVSGGSATGFTIIAHGGVGSFTQPASSYYVIFTGWGVGVSQPNGPEPCTTKPTAHVSSIINGQLWGIAFDTMGSGCDPNNTFFEVLPNPIMDEAYWFDSFTDGVAANLVSDGPVGVASLLSGPGAAGYKLSAFHGYGGDPVMLDLQGGQMDVDSPFCDTPVQACVVDTGINNWVHGGYRLHSSFYPGSGDFWDAQVGGNKYGPIAGCQTEGSQLGYNAFGGKTGPWNPTRGFALGSTSIENVDFCSQTGGGYPFSMTALPGGGGTGGQIELSVNSAGPGQAHCAVTAGAADGNEVPGYDPSSGIITFPADLRLNGGRITCVQSSGNVIDRIVPATGNTPQTFNLSTILTADVAGTYSEYTNHVFEGTVTFSGTAASSNCNQAGTLTSVKGCVVFYVGGRARYTPYF